MQASRIVDAVILHGNCPAQRLKTALFDCTGRSISYGELSDVVTKDVRRHSGIDFVFASPTMEFVVSVLKNTWADNSILIVPHETPMPRLMDLIDSYNPSRIYGTLDQLRNLGNATPDPQGLGLCYIDELAKCEIPQMFKGQLLLLTSGSLGSPKAARISQNALMQNAKDIVLGLAITNEDTAVTLLPLSYSFGLSIVTSHLLAGASILCSSVSALQKDFRDILEQAKVTNLSGVPFSFDTFDRIGILKSPPTSVRAFHQAGGKLAPKMVSRFSEELMQSKRQLYVMYGQTEATARIAMLPSELSRVYPNSVGYSVASGSLHIGSTSHPEEIIYRGPNVMLGYSSGINDLSLGDELQGELPTGDLGSLANGLLTVMGRMSRTLKLNGMRISLDHIEKVLQNFCDPAVTGSDNELIVYITDKPGLSRSEIFEVLSRDLGLMKRDVDIRVVESIPRLANGKVDYGRLS